MAIYYGNFFLILFLFYSTKLDFFKKYYKFLWIIIYLYFLSFISLRFEVGGDWQRYYEYFQNYNLDINEILGMRNEVGYNLLNYIIKYFGLNFFYLNLICAIISLTSIFFYIYKKSDPFLGLIVSYPLFIIVFTMGFVRQSIAFSFILFSIHLLEKKKYFYHILFILIGSLFHISALFFLILFPFYIFFLNFSKNEIFIIKSFIFLMTILIITFFIIKYFNIGQSLIYNYLGKGRFDNNYDYPAGALVRAILSIIPSILILFFSKKLFKEFHINKIYRFYSIIVICISLLHFIFPVFADRFLYYFIFLQIILFGNINKIINNNTKLLNILNLGVIFYYFIIFSVWINFADHKRWWLPYTHFTNSNI